VDNLCGCIMLVCFVSAENIARCSYNAKHDGFIEEETAAAWSLPMAAVGDGSVTRAARSSRGPRKGFLADAPWSNAAGTIPDQAFQLVPPVRGDLGAGALSVL
jgi:hypothetical protein